MGLIGLIIWVAIAFWPAWQHERAIASSVSSSWASSLCRCSWRT